jgi:type VI secretion system protein
VLPNHLTLVLMFHNSLRDTIFSQKQTTRTCFIFPFRSADSPPTDLLRLFILFFLFLFLICFIFSCGVAIRTRAVLGKKIHVTVDVSENANQNSPIAIDVLLVYDEVLLERLTKMTSLEWFEKRAQIKQDYLNGNGLDYWGWEWVPGQNVKTQSLPLKPKAKAGIIFAKYFAPGEHRSRVDPFKDFIIHLLEKRFTVEIPD